MAEFNYFGWNTPPIGKYTQPKKNTASLGKEEDIGYPQTGAEDNNVVMRGGGCAVKGKKCTGPMGGLK
jgi:hypothetical protein